MLRFTTKTINRARTATITLVLMFTSVAFPIPSPAQTVTSTNASPNLADPIEVAQTLVLATAEVKKLRIKVTQVETEAKGNRQLYLQAKDEVAKLEESRGFSTPQMLLIVAAALVTGAAVGGGVAIAISD